MKPDWQKILLGCALISFPDVSQARAYQDPRETGSVGAWDHFLQDMPQPISKPQITACAFKKIKTKRYLMKRQDVGTVIFCVKKDVCKHLPLGDYAPTVVPKPQVIQHHGEDPDFGMTLTPVPHPTPTTITHSAEMVTTKTSTVTSYSTRPATTNAAGVVAAGAVVATVSIVIVAIDASGAEVVLATVEEGVAEVSEGAEEGGEDEGGEEEGGDTCEFQIVTSAAEELWSTIRSMGEAAFSSLLFPDPEIFASPVTSTEPITTAPPPPPPPPQVDGVSCKTDGMAIDASWWSFAMGTEWSFVSNYAIDETKYIYLSMPLERMPVWPPENGVVPKGGDRIFFKLTRAGGDGCPPPGKLKISEQHGLKHIQQLQKTCGGANDKPTFGGAYEGDCIRIESWGIPEKDEEAHQQGLGWAP